MAAELSRRILKTMGLFGGVQAAVIALSILRTKLVAVWLGPMGVGLNAIFISTQELIVAAAGLNLRTGGVRELSAAPAASRPRVAGMLLRVAGMLAIVGCAATLLLSPMLSLWSMGTYGWWPAFAFLAAGVGAAVYLDADLAVLQSSGQLKALARVTFASAAVCTAASVPLYRWLGLQAVLPVYLLMTVVYALWARRERRAHCPRPQRPQLAAAWSAARPMLRLGVYLTLAMVMERLASYLFVVYMSRRAAPGDLGVYQAGFTLVNTYVGVIFTAISTEYYPRLAGVSSSRLRTQAFVSQEFKVAAWVLMPVVVVFVAADELMVRLLYADSFMSMLPYVGIAVCGVTLRAFSFCVAFVILARGDGRTYVVTEAAGALVGLAFRVAGYMLWGFAGLGAAYVAEYVVYSGVVLYVYRFRYGLRLGRGIVRLCLAATALGFIALAAKAAGGWWLPPVLVLPWLLPIAWRRLMAANRKRRSIV